jgi:hypothetical protein
MACQIQREYRHPKDLPDQRSGPFRLKPRHHLIRPFPPLAGQLEQFVRDEFRGPLGGGLLASVDGLADQAFQERAAEGEVTVDLATLSGHFEPLGDGWIAHKGGVRMRNLIAALLWDRWNQVGLNLAERTEKLALAGFPCTARQLEKFAEEYGLPKIPA